jgi:CBS domain-containing protein
MVEEATDDDDRSRFGGMRENLDVFVRAFEDEVARQEPVPSQASTVQDWVETGHYHVAFAEVGPASSQDVPGHPSSSAEVALHSMCLPTSLTSDVTYTSAGLAWSRKRPLSPSESEDDDQATSRTSSKRRRRGIPVVDDSSEETSAATPPAVSVVDDPFVDQERASAASGDVKGEDEEVDELVGDLTSSYLEKAEKERRRLEDARRVAALAAEAITWEEKVQIVIEGIREMAVVEDWKVRTFLTSSKSSMSLTSLTSATSYISSPASSKRARSFAYLAKTAWSRT